MRRLSTALQDILAERNSVAASAVRDLEQASAALQAQLAAELDRGDRLSGDFIRLTADKDRQQTEAGSTISRQSAELSEVKALLQEVQEREQTASKELKELRRGLREAELQALAAP